MPNYTNRPELMLGEDAKDWTFRDMAPQTEEEAASSPQFAPGATKTTGTGAMGGAGAGQEEAVPPIPELGMNPQGQWTEEKVRAMFPGMFQSDPSTWLDPAEEAKRREGLPYDQTKRYDETKRYPGIGDYALKNTPGQLLHGQDTTPPILKITQAQLHKQLTQQLGFDPILFNPMDEVIKADIRLPQLFERIFGKSWSDMSRLSKAERGHWEDVKARYHKRVLDAAKAKQQQGLRAYKAAMGEFAYDQKLAQWELERKDKEDAKTLQASKKTAAPSHISGYNASVGARTIWNWDPDLGKYVEAKDMHGYPIRSDAATQEDLYPVEIKRIRNRIKELQPSKNSSVAGAIAMMPDGPAKQRMMEGLSLMDKTMTPEAKAEVKALESEYSDFLHQRGKWENYDVNRGMAVPGSGVAKTRTTTGTPVNLDVFFAKLAQMKKDNAPRWKESYDRFVKVNPQYKDKLDEYMNAGAAKKTAESVPTIPDATSPTEDVAATSTLEPSERRFTLPKDKPGFLREVSILVSKGNHLVWDGFRQTVRALDYIGDQIIEGAKRLDVDLGKVIRGETLEAAREAPRRKSN